MAERLWNWQVEAVGSTEKLMITAGIIAQERDERPVLISRPVSKDGELTLQLTTNRLRELSPEEIALENCPEKTWAQRGLAHGFWSVFFSLDKNCLLTIKVTNRDGVPMGYDSSFGQITIYPEYD